MRYLSILLAVTCICLKSSGQNTAQTLVKCERANFLIQSGDYNDAIRIFEDCLKTKDTLPEVSYGAALAYYHSGNNKKAKKLAFDLMNTNHSTHKNHPCISKAAKLVAFIEDEENSGIDMVLVKGGTFWMGCKDGRDVECESQTKPSHPVKLDDYYIGKYEVTQAEWKKVMGNNPSGFKGCDKCPVENVSWDSVQVFLAKLNRLYPGLDFRLPTLAEWEFAARGGNKSIGYTFIGSNKGNEVGWYDENADGKTHPVGEKTPNELGLYDMGGNVWEWCSDWFGDYKDEDAINPTGPLTGTHKAYKGGAWQYAALYTRPAHRGDLNSYEFNNDHGFRLARPRKCFK